MQKRPEKEQKLKRFLASTITMVRLVGGCAWLQSLYCDSNLTSIIGIVDTLDPGDRDKDVDSNANNNNPS